MLKSDDFEDTGDTVGEVSDSFGCFRSIRKKTTSIRKTANEIDSTLDEIEGEMKSDLVDIRMEIQAAE